MPFNLKQSSTRKLYNVAHKTTNILHQNHLQLGLPTSQAKQLKIYIKIESRSILRNKIVIYSLQTMGLHSFLKLLQFRTFGEKVWAGFILYLLKMKHLKPPKYSHDTKTIKKMKITNHILKMKSAQTSIPKIHNLQLNLIKNK